MYTKVFMLLIVLLVVANVSFAQQTIDCGNDPSLMGDTYYMLNEFDKAKYCYENSIKLFETKDKDPDNYETYIYANSLYGVGLCLAEMSKLQNDYELKRNYKDRSIKLFIKSCNRGNGNACNKIRELQAKQERNLLDFVANYKPKNTENTADAGNSYDNSSRDKLSNTDESLKNDNNTSSINNFINNYKGQKIGGNFKLSSYLERVNTSKALIDEVKNIGIYGIVVESNLNEIKQKVKFDFTREIFCDLVNVKIEIISAGKSDLKEGQIFSWPKNRNVRPVDILLGCPDVGDIVAYSPPYDGMHGWTLYLQKSEITNSSSNVKIENYASKKGKLNEWIPEIKIDNFDNYILSEYMKYNYPNKNYPKMEIFENIKDNGEYAIVTKSNYEQMKKEYNIFPYEKCNLVSINVEYIAPSWNKGRVEERRRGFDNDLHGCPNVGDIVAKAPLTIGWILYLQKTDE